MYFSHYFCKAAILVSVITKPNLFDDFLYFSNLKTKKYISKLNKLFVFNYFINSFDNLILTFITCLICYSAHLAQNDKISFITSKKTFSRSLI